MKRAVHFVILQCLVALSGCGPRTAPVEGDVSFDGKPVQQGMISFEPKDGNGPSTQAPIRGGSYSLRGELAPTIGAKVVRITAIEQTGKKIDLGGGRTTDDYRQYLPAKYNDQSELWVDISSGGLNRHDFNLNP